MDAPYRVVRYVKNELGLGILLSSKKATQLTRLCDADWTGYPNFRRSITGYVMKLESFLIS